MEILTFEYSMEIEFCGEQPAREHAFSLRALPQEGASQHVLSCEVKIRPDVALSYGTDAFGTEYCYGIVHESHRLFSVDVRGEVQRDADSCEEAPDYAGMVYRQQTAATVPGRLLTEMYETMKRDAAYHSAHEADLSEGQDCRLRQAYYIRDLVHHSMEYTPGATVPFTKAEQAAENGKGVCQDYAHIMLSLCRMDGIPCRYTAGLLAGVGESHAWVEICSHGRWISFDPTNPDVRWDQQLIFSHGRDARDCEINRGVFLGSDTQKQSVRAELQVRKL